MRLEPVIQSARRLRAAASRAFTDRVILFIGWLWFLVYGFPGYMSADSTYQLSQSRGDNPLNDWHPPMMAFIWRYLDKLIAGPFLMLVLQSVTFLIGLYVVLTHVMSKRAAAIVAVLVLLAPQNIHVMAVIWKDSQMAGFLMAAIAGLLSERRRWRIVGYLFIFLATAVRYNAAAPTFPIVILLFDRHGTLHWLRRYGTACVLWVALTLAAFKANEVMIKRHDYVWVTGAAPVDIYGVLYFAPSVDTDALEREFPDAPWAAPGQIREVVEYGYKPDNNYWHAVEGPQAILKFPSTPKQRDAIAGVWKKVVFGNPLAFFKHRVSVFITQLRAGVTVWDAFVNEGWAEDGLKHRATPSSIQAWWVSIVKKLAGKRILRAKMYFVLTLIFLLLCRRQRIAFVVLMSGLAHATGVMLVAPAVDYRYIHWTVVCAIVGGIVLFARRINPQGGELRTGQGAA